MKRRQSDCRPYNWAPLLNLGGLHGISEAAPGG